MQHHQPAADAITRLLFAIDRLDWLAIGAILATQVHVDYTSLFGGTPEQLSRDELLARWRSLLPGFDATQHMTGPVVLTVANDQDVVAETHVRGYHHIGAGDMWMVAGHYVMGLRHEGDVWRIHSIQLQMFHQDGRLDLPQLAAARVNAGKTRASRI